VAVAIPVVSFGLPLLDVCLSIVRRYMNNKPLFVGDEDHVHHKLIKRGFSHRKAVLILYAVAAAFGMLSLTLLHSDMMIGLVLFLIGLGVWIGVQQLRYVELVEITAFARQIRQRKRITANNLQVRRAMESLPKGSADFPEMCRVLQTALGSVGFCGISLSFSNVRWLEGRLPSPLQRDGGGEHFYLPVKQHFVAPQWELKLELTSASGEKLGELNVFRERASDPLLVDMSLLDGDFRIAVSCALEGALERLCAFSKVEEKSEVKSHVLRSRVTATGA
jgi:hypothetical protein